MTRTFVGSLAVLAVLCVQRSPSWAQGSPLRNPVRAASFSSPEPGRGQRHNEAPACEGLVEEVGDRDRLPPWAMGLVLDGGGFFSLFRFNTRRQAEACAATREDFKVQFWDRKSRSWKAP